jgi:hypothetical protein
VKDVFAKKFFGAGRDSAGGALASVLRKHSIMKKLTCVLAILAAASTAAVAKDLKQDKKAMTNAQAVSATQMDDSEMDKVTAGTQGGVVFGMAMAILTYRILFTVEEIP